MFLECISFVQIAIVVSDLYSGHENALTNVISQITR